MELTFTQGSFKDFKSKYKKAVRNKDLIFSYQDKDILTGYAKYVIEYYEPLINPKENESKNIL